MNPGTRSDKRKALTAQELMDEALYVEQEPNEPEQPEKKDD